MYNKGDMVLLLKSTAQTTMEQQMNFNDYVKILEKAGAKPVNTELSGGELNRQWKLQILGQNIIFEVYANLVNVYFGIAQVVVDRLELRGTWPNKYKMNLQCSYLSDSTCLIIPIEEY